MGSSADFTASSATRAAPAEHLNVLIVGAGLSGIDAAYRLQTECPNETFALLEARDAIGGTWDFFRYPGVRSDSDMHTLGFPFRPWTDLKAIADGQVILDYIVDTAKTFGIDKKIRFGHAVQAASWDSTQSRWLLEVKGPNAEVVQLSCDFLYMCSGYYDYDEGHSPSWPNLDAFQGQLVHPQYWPKQADVSGKRVVVIGSGATAVTLVPELAKTAAHVTMLQRSPTYIVARPAQDAIANRLHRILPPVLAHRFTRIKNVALQMFFYSLARRRPEKIKKRLLDMAQQQLGPDYDVATHLTPRYKPWDQRLCLIPDGDLFNAIREGRASIQTDEIASFTNTGLQLKSGAELPADMVVTATGLKLKVLGGLALYIDGRQINLAHCLTYKGVMYSDVPNLALAFGYTNASWTLHCDLTARYVCRLLRYMRTRRYTSCTPRVQEPQVATEPAFALKSGYVDRARDLLPRQGSKAPWQVNQNYLKDILQLKLSAINDGSMEFRAAKAKAVA